MAGIRSIVHNLSIVAGIPVFDALGLLQVHHDTALFSQMRELSRLPQPEANADGKKVLFLSLKGTWKSHLAWEYSMAMALKVRGAKPAFLLNDNFFPKCDVRIHHNPTCTRAWAAHAYSKLFAKYVNMPTYWLGNYIAPEERTKLAKLAYETPYERLAEIQHNGIDIDYTVKPSLVRFFRRGSVPDTARGRRVHREFVLAGLLASEALPKALDAIEPDRVVAVNGKFFAENIMFQFCRRRGIDIFTYERGKIKDTLNIVCNQISVDQENTYAWNTVKDRHLTEDEWAVIRGYIDDRKKGGRTVMRFHPNPEENEAAVKQAAGFEEGKKHFALFSNIVWDSAVQYRDIGFDNMFDWIRLTIDFFGRHPEANLIVRLHPAEVKISSDVTMEKSLDYLNSVFDEFPENVRVIPPESDVSSYKLIDYCDTIIVYTSTIGIEAALEEKPTVVCGETHFSHKGFTIDIETQQQYYEVLEQLMADASPVKLDWEAAWKYAYIFFFKCMIPFPCVSEQAIGLIEGVSFDDPSELAHGKDANLDLICDAILNATQALP